MLFSLVSVKYKYVRVKLPFILCPVYSSFWFSYKFSYSSPELNILAIILDCSSVEQIKNPLNFFMSYREEKWPSNPLVNMYFSKFRLQQGDDPSYWAVYIFEKLKGPSRWFFWMQYRNAHLLTDLLHKIQALAAVPMQEYSNPPTPQYSLSLSTSGSSPSVN